MARKRSRLILTIGAVAAIGAALAYAFWPRPLLVDIGEVTRGPMVVTIDEEGRTRVKDAYVISTPTAGRLLRVEVEPGDAVKGDQTIVARMLPANPPALDFRTREEARAGVAAAEAALRLAQADLRKAIADKELADTEFERRRQLLQNQTVSQAAFDTANRLARAAQASVDTAHAAISMREAEIASAKAQLISINDPGSPMATGEDRQPAIPIKAPTTGNVLRVMQRSETTLPAGTPILEIGNVENGLEVVVELLSTDAVQVKVDDRVVIDNWGGPNPLAGRVERVDPWGFTKVSALGVEEQRVDAIVRFTDLDQPRTKLGPGFRVEARIVVWEAQDTIVVPSNALWRDGGDWAVFVVDNGIASARKVQIDQNNGIDANVVEGLQPGDTIILYPSSGLEDGSRVAQR